MKKSSIFIICLLILITSLVACDNASSGENQLTDTNSLAEYEVVNPSDAQNIRYDLEKINTGLIDGNQKFAFEIFKRLNEEDMNESIFISPLSISQALAMAYNGAETTTKEGMSKALGLLGLERDLVNESYRNLMNYLLQMMR